MDEEIIIPRKKICNLSTQKFAEIIDVAAFVDKTLFIKAFLEDENDVIVAMAPRRFGKSTNMDMVKEFVSGNNKLFKVNKLKIIKESNFFYENCTKNPVIHADFRNVRGNNRDQILESIKHIIQVAYGDHKYLVKQIEGNYVWIDEKKLEGAEITVTDFMNYWKDPKNLTENEVITALRRLSHCLHMYHDKPVYVFIDDYDTSIMRAIIKTNASDTVLHEIIDLVSEVSFDFLKGNKHVKKALINATTRVAEVFSLDENNIQYYEFLRKPSFAPYFGFTDKEVEELFKRDEFVTLNNSDVQKYYGGYIVMDTNEYVIYSSYSILNYLKKNNTVTEIAKIKNYWVDFGYITNLKELFTISAVRELIAKLIDGVVEIKTINKITKNEIFTLKSLMHQQLNAPRFEDACLFLQFLLGNGYLNAIKNTEHQLKLKNTLIIPNKEIKQLFREKYYNTQLIEQTYELNHLTIYEYVEALHLILEKRQRYSFIKLARALSILFHDGLMPNSYQEMYDVLFTLIYKYEEYRIGSELSAQLIDGRNILLILDNVGMIIKYGFSHWHSSDIQKYQAPFNKYKDITVKIFMSFNINNLRHISLNFKIDNSETVYLTHEDY